VNKLLKSIAVLGLCVTSAGASNQTRAVKIHKLLVREGSKVSVQEIRDVLDAIDVNLKTFFPHGPFTKEDFISIAMTESRFDKRCVGTSGERGVFQVMPGYHHAGNLSDTRTNTRLAFLILRQKLKEHKDRRKAIIAYNGYLVRNGRLRDTYWLAVLKQKQRILSTIG
jgi:hypothetical protein